MTFIRYIRYPSMMNLKTENGRKSFLRKLAISKRNSKSFRLQKGSQTLSKLVIANGTKFTKWKGGKVANE